LTVLHGAAQPPQLFTSLLVWVSQPLRAMFSSAEQSAYPELQTTLHWPLVQVAAPLALLQAPPQLPQLASSVLLLTSQPLPMSPSQLRKPAAQVYWQAPSEQPPETMLGGAFAAQSLPQLPQFWSSTASSDSQPLSGSLSQLSKPVSQA